MLIHVEQWELQIGPSTGAAVVYTKKDLRGKTLEVWLDGEAENKRMAQVVERDGKYAAIFPALAVGNHKVWLWDKKGNKRSIVSVFAGNVAEVDWR